MFASIFGAHQLLISDYPHAPTPPAAPPAPPQPPQPPQAQPIAFSVSARPSLFAIVGSATGTVTLATVTCTDASMTVSVNVSVPGLTFAYAANTLTVSGTPTGPTANYRVVVSYIASDGTSSVRGTSSHDITIVAAAEVLIIGSMAGAAGRVGWPLTATLANPTTNYAVSVTAYAQSLVGGITYVNVVSGLRVTLAWTKGASSGSGVLTLSGIPDQAGTYILTVNFYAPNTLLLGTSTHTVDIAPAYQAPPPAPAPAPAPSPPAPSPPPVPSPVLQPGAGPDAYFSSVKALLHFDLATGVLVDQKGNTWASGYVSSTTGAVGQAALFYSDSGSYVQSTIAGIDAATNYDFTAECFVDIGQTAWDALTAAGDDERYCPVLSYMTAAGDTIWMLGFIRWGGLVFRAFWHKNSASSLPRNLVDSAGWMPARPARFVHFAVNSYSLGANGRFDMWFDGANDQSMTVGGNDTSATGILKIGGTTPLIRYLVNTKDCTCIPFQGAIDEVRITGAARYASYTGAALPASQRVIPWPNY